MVVPVSMVTGAAGGEAGLDAGRGFGFNADDGGAGAGGVAAVVGDGGLQERADAGGDQDEVKPVGTDVIELVVDLVEQCVVAFDDGCGDVLVALPRGVLHEDCSRCAGGQLSCGDRVVVASVDADQVGALVSDVLGRGRMDAAGNVDAGPMAEQPGEVSNSATVVAVGGGDDGQRIAVVVVGDGDTHRPGRAEPLERTEAESGGLVLGQHPATPSRAATVGRSISGLGA